MSKACSCMRDMSGYKTIVKQDSSTHQLMFTQNVKRKMYRVGVILIVISNEENIEVQKKKRKNKTG